MLACSSHASTGAGPSPEEVRRGVEQNSRRGLFGRPENTANVEEAGTSRARGEGEGRNGGGGSSSEAD